ncbi:MAG: redox-regulated ATPase YchF [Acidiferrobacterales bacterium]
MGFKCGIVGLPNTGKSTLFNALAQMHVPAESYPFCTIEPNVGIVPVPDERLECLAEIAKPERVVSTTIEFVDIAGLVAGASKGEGLGNQFLAHIREVDAIAHVVRCFDDENVPHVADRLDPVRDVETVNTELALADLETVTRALERAHKSSKAGDKEEIKLGTLLEQVEAHLNKAEPLRALQLAEEDAMLLRPLNLLTAKPVLYVANVSETGFAENPHVQALQQLADSEGAEVVTLRVRLTVGASALEMPPVASTGSDPLLGHRDAWFDGPARAAVYDRSRLSPGDTLAGPAIVVQMDATTALPPGWRGAVDAWGNLVLESGRP